MSFWKLFFRPLAISPSKVKSRKPERPVYFGSSFFLNSSSIDRGARFERSVCT